MEDGWLLRHQLSASERLEVLDLLNRVEVTTGRESLDENRRRIVLHHGEAEHWLEYRDGRLQGFALATGSDPIVLEAAGGSVDEGLLSAVSAVHAEFDVWCRGPEPLPSASEVVRTLDLMEVALPIPVVPLPDGVTQRAFDPSSDAERWLEQNNLAFADHPEQGAWRMADLRMRVAERWFDPSGFLLFTDEDEIVASCWTKIHELHPDRFGEIYVISVHPHHQGRGLGRVAVTHGLEHLRRRGVDRAILFVDRSNHSAKALYEHLGFHTVREDHLVRVRR